jgi:hypothetical protein
VTSARVWFNSLIIAVFLLNSFGAENAARGQSRLSGLSLEPFRTFRILDAKLSVLTGEQVALDRTLNGDSTPQSRTRLLKSMWATTNAITSLANRLERIYARRHGPFGVHVFKVLGNRATTVQRDLAALRKAPTQNRARVSKTKLDKDIIALVVQFQAVAGGHEVTHCPVGDWTCCEPKRRKDLMPGQAAACGWVCLANPNRCTGLLGPRIRRY